VSKKNYTKKKKAEQLFLLRQNKTKLFFRGSYKFLVCGFPVSTKKSVIIYNHIEIGPNFRYKISKPPQAKHFLVICNEKLS